MSFKVKKLIVGKGRTRGNEKEGWTKTFYQVEVEISDEHDIEIARASVEGLITGWLTPSELTSQTQPQTQSQAYDTSKIKWEDAQGAKGRYQRSQDVNSLDFKALLKDLASHGGKMQRNGYFFWTFQDGHTIGKKRK